VKGEEETKPLDIQEVLEEVTAAANRAEQSAQEAKSAATIAEGIGVGLAPPGLLSSDIPEGETGERGKDSSTSGLLSSAISKGETGVRGVGLPTSGLLSSVIPEGKTGEEQIVATASEVIAQAIEIDEARKDAEILRKARDFLILEAARAFLKAGMAKRKAGKGNSLIKGSNLAKQLERSKIPFLPTQSRQNPTTYSTPTAKRKSPFGYKPPNIKRGNIGNERAPLERVKTNFNTNPSNQNRRLKDIGNANAAAKKKVNNAAAKKRVNNAAAAKKQQLVDQANKAAQAAEDSVGEVETALKTIKIEEQTSNSPATKKALQDVKKSITGLEKASTFAQQHATMTASATTVEEATNAAGKANRLGSHARTLKRLILDNLKKVSKARETTN